MDTVICLLPVIPIRREPSHRSEQTSQLIFGEKAEIIDHKDNWIEIRTLFDSYNGWIEQKSVETVINARDEQKLTVTTEPITICENEEKSIYLTAGSDITQPDGSNSFQIKGNYFKLKSPVPDQKKYTRAEVIKTAMKLLNVPYLWGGRTVFGIDCSGFVQIVFKIHGQCIPRDAKDQANIGIPVNSFDEIVPGDLVFFDNTEGKITHVGIVLNENKVIHASICVKIDPLDQKGIYNLKRNEHSHSLKLIRRVL